MSAHNETRPGFKPRAGLNRRGLAYALPGILNSPPVVVTYDPGDPGIVFGGPVAFLRYHFPVKTNWVCEVLEMGHFTTAGRAMKFYDDPPEEWDGAKTEFLKFLG